MTLIERLNAFFGDGGAPWVGELGFVVTAAEPGAVTFTMPGGAHLVHSGGVICGQSIMAGMDTGMVYVMYSLIPEDEYASGEARSFTTVQLQTTFERGAPADTTELTFRAWATKVGKRLVFGQIDCYLPDEQRCASATTQYMWLG